MSRLIERVKMVDPSMVIKGDLSCPEFPTKVRKVKGLEFNPEVILSSGKLYFIVVTNRYNYVPVKGFYDVPNKGYITWIGKYRMVAMTSPVKVGAVEHIAYIFEMMEDTPPLGATPFRTKGSSGGVPPGIIY